ncbi:hypothetical protein WA1_47895 [Scytonema hofmannii PCC 7110]|uniref:Uncharacterized protein n=1 Tax=Scytonema hofmannii PCC 7110 TaxID=128403 RepID=A0A139WY20_9CYAN|nr:hypothetical protein [Scytonema hofmannii]KYC37339.1 hypothetical protein WA1_47895 [Scytonema hofmannii PCC 7110]
MSHIFSLDKSTTTFQVLVAGIAASLFASGLTSNIEQQISQPTSQLTASSLTTSQESTEQTNQSALILASVLAGSLIVGVALRGTASKSASATGTSSVGNKKNTFLIFNQGSRKLQKKLLLLLHDDREAANRLLTQAVLKYTNKTVDWYFEKVIYDLERDRHA